MKKSSIVTLILSIILIFTITFNIVPEPTSTWIDTINGQLNDDKESKVDKNKIVDLCDEVVYTKTRSVPVYSTAKREIACNPRKAKCDLALKNGTINCVSEIKCSTHKNGTTYDVQEYQVTNYIEEEYTETECYANGAVSNNGEIISYEDFFCKYCEDEEIIMCHHNYDGLGKYNNCEVKPGQTTMIIKKNGKVITENSFHSKFVKKELKEIKVKEVSE